MKPLHRVAKTDCLSVSVRSGRFHDFATGDSGPLEKLIRMTNGGSIEFAPEKDVVAELKDEVVPEVRDIGPLFPSYSFYNKRGISNKTLETFQAGFCQGDKMYNRFVFPIYNPDNSLVGYAGRRVDGNDKAMKWKIVGKKNLWVYPVLWNAGSIKKSKEIIVVESIGNMLALWEAGLKHSIICFGTSCSKALLSTIISFNPKRIILGFDNDEGANPGQTARVKMQNELEKWFDKSKICTKLTPVGRDLSDIWAQEKINGIKNWYK
jgi:hypothetical protein